MAKRTDQVAQFDFFDISQVSILDFKLLSTSTKIITLTPLVQRTQTTNSTQLRNNVGLNKNKDENQLSAVCGC
jgi:hypothetical protein